MAYILEETLEVTYNLDEKMVANTYSQGDADNHSRRLPRHVRTSGKI